jgi:hypothetical protein
MTDDITPPVQPIPGGPDEAVRYEVAEEMVNRLRAAAARRLAEARRPPGADPAAVRRLEAEVEHLVELRRTMFRRGPVEVEALIAEYGPRARALVDPTAGR